MRAVSQSWKPLSRSEMAARVARDIPEGWYVNLGIGMPTLVSNYLPPDKEIILHSENGIVGMGPEPQPGAINPWLVNAGKQYVTLVTGGAYVHHADSFAMIRGGHIDLCVLGAFRGRENGDLANWATLDERHAARGRRRDGPLRRRQASMGYDGSHDQVRRKQAGEALFLIR